MTADQSAQAIQEAKLNPYYLEFSKQGQSERDASRLAVEQLHAGQRGACQPLAEEAARAA